MKSITIHGIDKETEKLIKKRAKSEGKSVNKTVKALLAKALGIDKDKQDNKEEFMDLHGIWTEDDEKSFFEAIKDLEHIHPEDWK
jgi:plasmid stability protein